MNRTLKALCLAPMLVCLGMAGSVAQEAKRVVNVFNWSDYIDTQVLKDFETETGIKVVYDVYDKNEIIEAKLATGKSGYDVVVPSGPFLQRFIKAKYLRPLDLDKLPNRKNLWPEIAQRLTVFDPGNKFAINYMWGTTGIGVNVKKVRERLGDMPLDSWDLLLKPDVIAKLKDCGVHVLDAPEDIFPGVLRVLGIDPDSKKLPDLEKATAALMKIRTSVRKFHSSEYINALANGDICMAVGYSGDIVQARNRAIEARNGVEVAYVVPREGALMWFDSFAIPVDAPNVAEAHAFIDFMMRPEIAAKNSNVVNYASGNLAAKAGINKDILDNPGVYPNDATFRRLFTNTAYDDKLQRSVTRLWTRVVTGK